MSRFPVQRAGELRRARAACPVYLLTFAACATGLAGQTIRVGENVPVPIGLEERPLVEPHLAVHPSNPDHLLGATIISAAAASRPTVMLSLRP